MTLRIVLAGPRGKMGTEAIKMIREEENFELVGCIDRKNDGKQLKDILEDANEAVPIYENAQQCFTALKPDIFVDLTVPEAGFQHVKVSLQASIKTVVGTSGFTKEQIDELRTIAEQTKTGCIIAPNFALGAVLMMYFSKIAAKFLTDVEVIEKHHDKKIDAPSGTAVKTIELIRESRESKQQGHPDEYESIAGSRGGNVDGIRVHSVRLPGLIAHQEVIFGGKSELFTIKHDSFHRESFMPGLKLAIEKVNNYDYLVYGLEHVMNLE